MNIERWKFYADGSITCFDICKHNAWQIVLSRELEDDRQCQFIIVSAYVSVTVSVTCLFSIQIPSVERWTDIEFRD